MNDSEKIVKNALEVVSFSKDIVISKLVSANNNNRFSPKLTEDQLKTTIELINSSVEEGCQKAIPSLTKTVDTIMDVYNSLTLNTTKKKK